MKTVHVAFDPHADERRLHYTPQQLGAFLRIAMVLRLCAKPGVFLGDAGALRRSLPRDTGRQVTFLLEQGDLAQDGTGKDAKVRIATKDVRYRTTQASRQAKYRGRQKARETPSKVAPTVTETVTRTVTETVTESVTPSVTEGVTKPPPEPSRVYVHIPPSSSSIEDVQDMSGDARLREERKPGGKDRPSEADRLAAFLLDKGMFDFHPRPALKCAERARQVIAWGGGFEEAGELWEHVERASETPRKLLGWALKDPGKWKEATRRVPRKRPEPAPGFVDPGTLIASGLLAPPPPPPRPRAPTHEEARAVFLAQARR